MQQQPTMPAGWTPQQEAAFRPWMNQTAASAGTNANANSPLHAYDYRALYNSGDGMALDSGDNRMHGSSQFKQPEHPNRFVIHEGQLIDSITGKPVTAKQALIDALRRP